MDVSVCAVVCVYVISDAFSQCFLKNIDKRTMREKKRGGVPRKQLEVSNVWDHFVARQQCLIVCNFNQ